MLAPLTRLTPNKRKFKRTKIKQDAFDEIKRILARDILLSYPNFNGTFKIHTNASAFQLGSVIIQKGKLIAFYSRKLTYTQRRYTVTEKEILSIVEIIREFRTRLPGQKLQFYTDHKTLDVMILIPIDY